MKAYNYNQETLEYTGSTEADPDPMNEGGFLFPAFSTNIEPPEQIQGKARIFVNESWAYVDIPEVIQEPVVTEDTAPVISDKEKRILEIVDELSLIDIKSIRPLRSILVNGENQEDTEILSSLDSKATALRVELDGLKQLN